MRKWFYVDITTTCHERVAVKAEDEEQAKGIVETLVDAGTIDFSEAGNSAYGSINDSITVAEREFKRPPTAMRKFDGLREEVKASSRHGLDAKRGKHVISYYWRGDNEDTEYRAFPTQEAAWAHVVRVVRKRIKAFKPEETTRDHGPTIVDWDKLKSDLFDKGYGTVEYCQCSAWWDNWGYFKRS